tara:strand:- start:1082 stop:1765 length:684 start_codon:yes stop_codon:yes gene_type:complete
MLITTHYKKIYSQYGEEGIIEYFIDKLSLKHIQCCEFGMNSKTNSNTFYFIENYNSYGVYIEQKENKLSELIRDNTIVINKKVEKNGSNTLDNILKETKLVKDFDILSIDIDNEDYHIWDSLKHYEPKIVIIEINPFIELGREYIYDGSLFSSSFTSTVNLGEQKGYTLVCMTGNLIFVKTSILKKNNLDHLVNVDPNKYFLNDAFVRPENRQKIDFRRYNKPNNII